MIILTNLLGKRASFRLAEVTGEIVALWPDDKGGRNFWIALKKADGTLACELSYDLVLVEEAPLRVVGAPCLVCTFPSVIPWTAKHGGPFCAAHPPGRSS